ncbi:MAG TPA: discoidin domain-containing protein [Verrucomicrobiae bacterium]|jgi:hypothetical protein|nr:discoidin domain-containing protein [Verrucomicrobiae bacterium]
MKLIVSSMVLAACIAQSQAQDLVPLKIKLPAPAFIGTPSDLPVGTTVEKPTGKPRPPLMVPPNVVNLALGKTVTSSSTNVLAADLKKITDGDKESRESSVVLLRKGAHWVQIDLGAPAELFAIVIWHNHDAPKVYHGVVVEVSDDPEFKSNVQVVFNNDHANMDGLGVGTNREYFETNEGKLIETHNVKGRYVRAYSDGSTESKLNEYLEIEVYGRPAS